MQLLVITSTNVVMAGYSTYITGTEISYHYHCQISLKIHYWKQVLVHTPHLF